MATSAIASQSATVCRKMRIHHGPGYRVYFMRREKTVYLLLVGGDKGPHCLWQQISEGSTMTRFERFDASDYLDGEELIAEYLAAALEDGNSDVFIAALGDVAKAQGMAQIANKAGLGRESLYKALRSGSKLRYETVQKVLAAIGVKLTVIPAAA
jgi:probable addiction module antidote protein